MVITCVIGLWPWSITMVAIFQSSLIGGTWVTPLYQIWSWWCNREAWWQLGYNWLLLTGDTHSLRTRDFLTIRLFLVDPFKATVTKPFSSQLSWMTAVLVYAPHPTWAIIKIASLWRQVYVPMPKEWSSLRAMLPNRTGGWPHNNWQCSDITKNDRAYNKQTLTTAAICQPPLVASVINRYSTLQTICNRSQQLSPVING